MLMYSNQGDAAVLHGVLDSARTRHSFEVRLFYVRHTLTSETR